MKEGASREGVRVLVVEHSRVGLSDAVYALVIVHVLTLEEVQPGTDLHYSNGRIQLPFKIHRGIVGEDLLALLLACPHSCLPNTRLMGCREEWRTIFFQDSPAIRTVLSLARPRQASIRVFAVHP